MRRGAKPAKAKVAAKRPIPRKALKNEGSRVPDLEKRLAEALEQQTATSEILRVISTSPTDLQPVFETIAENAVRLCDATVSGVLRFDGALIHLAAYRNFSPAVRAIVPQDYPMEPTRRRMSGRAILDRTVVHAPDVLSDPDYPQEVARSTGWRSFLSVPMLREGQAIGAVTVVRTLPGPFSDRQIALLQTFADQAVIAIENVRLFNELGGRNRDLTATSDILQVISRSPTDAQPVFDTIAERAMRLCNAAVGFVGMFDGVLIHVRALTNMSPEGINAIHQAFPAPPSRGSAGGRVILTGDVVQIPDALEDPEYQLTGAARAVRFRGILGVPMLHQGRAIGVISVGRPEPGTFSEEQVQVLKTFADQAVIAVQNVRLFTELQASNRELTKALDTQTATSDILRVISRSQTDVQPVFDAIVASAVRLLRGYSGGLSRIAGDLITLAAITSTGLAGDDAARATFPRAVNSQTPHGQAIRTRAPVNIADVHTDPSVTEDTRTHARVRGWRSAVAVPMLRHEEAIGAISVTRGESGGFTNDEIALLQTFADQAVIAIENVRLFNETKEALEQQTATGEILGVISRSPTDIQPVFDAIVRSGAALCQASDVIILIADRDSLRVVATVGPVAASVQQSQLLQGGVLPLTRGSVSGRAFIDRRTVNVHDVGAMSDDEFPEGKVLQREYGGHGTTLAVPLLREEVSLGVITLLRSEVSPFTDRQVALLQTFADQAVIAVENVRLFKELEARNRDLTEALEQQTATSEILGVISRSQVDVQPVFDTIVQSGLRLLGGYSATMMLLRNDDCLDLVAYTSTSVEADASLVHAFPLPLRSIPAGARAVQERRAQAVEDVESAGDVTDVMRETGRARGWRSNLFVPMIRDDVALGLISITRRNPGPFGADQIALLETFAAQAVIAIENGRLFTELEARTADLTRSVEQLTALGEVGRAVSSTLDLGTVLTTIVSRAVQLSGLDGGVVFEYDEGAEEFVQRAAAETGGVLAQARRGTRFRKGEGVLGRTAITLEPVQVSDITVPGAYDSRLRENLIESGIRAILAVPMVREGRLIGCLGVTRNRPGEFPAETIELLRTFATQSALAIQNARLFHEIEDKSRQLEVASRHKSEFLANMSHELRTPLNAIIGFSEVLAERMFGEVNAKQAEYLQDILESGRHLLSLINDILDLSKIEAGRMELEPADFHLPSAIDNALILVRERATRHGITLGRHIDEGLGVIHGDERKVKQVLLNLLSNALKFTPEGGRIEVRAALHEGRAEVSVADTGVGIAPEDQEAVFEEFRQVGTADKKVEGTGLGLALSQKFVELHGGRIWVESEVGRGSTFTFTLPLS